MSNSLHNIFGFTIGKKNLVYLNSKPQCSLMLYQEENFNSFSGRVFSLTFQEIFHCICTFLTSISVDDLVELIVQNVRGKELLKQAVKKEKQTKKTVLEKKGYSPPSKNYEFGGRFNIAGWRGGKKDADETSKQTITQSLQYSGGWRGGKRQTKREKIFKASLKNDGWRGGKKDENSGISNDNNDKRSTVQVWRGGKKDENLGILNNNNDKRSTVRVGVWRGGKKDEEVANSQNAGIWRGGKKDEVSTNDEANINKNGKGKLKNAGWRGGKRDEISDNSQGAGVWRGGKRDAGNDLKNSGWRNGKKDEISDNSQGAGVWKGSRRDAGNDLKYSGWRGGKRDEQISDTSNSDKQLKEEITSLLDSLLKKNGIKNLLSERKKKDLLKNEKEKNDNNNNGNKFYKQLSEDLQTLVRKRKKDDENKENTSKSIRIIIWLN